jgi:hypothetical protein
MLGLFKTKDIEITNKQEFEKTLTRLIELLENNAFTGQSTVVRELLDALQQGDRKTFLKIITGIDMWGGSGAVWEVGGFRNDADEPEFYRHMITLTEAMKQIGIKCGSAYAATDFLKKALTKTETK